ncbi:uncharacterized protein LOC114326470 [Diabrotica virgifera virgifera]|uniref:Uncharacterized protein LOC114326470 n=1 Tax=Diabrotica virgifera virgifera TaxID=50390 RepID=A0A6P7FB24_DIAVI|nr:uncharacterized protein LOC114326470 [Diabrotica virgifera virgifera]
MELEGKDSEENKREKRRNKKKQDLSDDERKLLLQCASKFQLHKYYESIDNIKGTMNAKWIQCSEIFKDKGYERTAEKLGNQYQPLKLQAIKSMSTFYVQRCGVKPTKLDYLFAYLFPKYFDDLRLNMDELMADAKVNAAEILESLASTEDQERPMKDTASLEHSNAVEPQPNLKRPHVQEAEGPANKITKEVHEDEAAWLKRMLDITRGRNNCESTTTESLTNENNSSTEEINALKAKLLVIKNKIKEQDHQLELKNLEISHLNELHTKSLELEKMKFALQLQMVENKN